MADIEAAPLSARNHHCWDRLQRAHAGAFAEQTKPNSLVLPQLSRDREMGDPNDEPWDDSVFEFTPVEDEQDIPVSDDWRTRPSRPPPRKPKYLHVLDELCSRPNVPDEEFVSRQPTPEAQDKSSMLPPAALRSSRRIPREVTYEIMRASPELVSAFKDARNAYSDAIYAWWHRTARERWETPTEIDYELVKLDPRVRAAERSLLAADARLSAEGRSVKVATVRNDGSARRAMLEDTERIEAEWQAAQASNGASKGRKRRRKAAPTQDLSQFLPPEPPEPMPAPTPVPQEAPTPASTVSVSTARTSSSAEVLSDYSATSPESEDDRDDKVYKPNWRFTQPKRRKAAAS